MDLLGQLIIQAVQDHQNQQFLESRAPTWTHANLAPHVSGCQELSSARRGREEIVRPSIPPPSQKEVPNKVLSKLIWASFGMRVAWKGVP